MLYLVISRKGRLVQITSGCVMLGQFISVKSDGYVSLCSVNLGQAIS
jgi:hypothetical protein